MKRLIAIIIALSLIIFSFAVSVSATEITNSITSKEYYAAQAYLVAKFKDGDITYSEFQEQSQSVTDAYIEANTVGGVLTQSALTASNTFNAVAQKIGETVSNFGDSAKDYISDWISDFLDDYTVFSDKPSTDTKGYGAMMYVVQQTRNTTYYSYYYCDYISVRPGEEYVTYYTQGGYYREYWNTNNSTVNTYKSSSNFGEHNRNESGSTTTVYVYGDVRYPDGSPAPTDDTMTTEKDYDFTQTPDGEPVSEQDLQELLNDILEELERQQPDLSTVDGLLKSIYNRLGKLDSDNDNALLNDINSAILSLIESEDENAAEIVEALLGIREDLKNGGSGGLPKHDHDEIAGTLYNVKPLDKNFFNKLFTDSTELKVEYEGKNYFLEPCGCLKIDDKYYSVDMNYDSFTIVDYDFSNEYFEIDRSKYVDVDFNNYGKMWANLSTTQKNKINSVVDLIYKMVEQSVPYSMVTTTLQLYQLVIFNTATPEDIVLTFKSFDLFGTTVDGFEVTILSTSFFANENVANAMKIVKSFLTVVIGYAWLLVMRKKVTAMMG